MTEKTLIFTGQSPNGIHKTETAMLCLRRRGWDVADEHAAVVRKSPALARGVLLHVGLAHYYARLQCAQAGTDPDVYYTPEDAVSLIPGMEDSLCPDVLREQTPVVLRALAGYYSRWMHDRVRVLAVERVVSIPLPGFGGPGEPPEKTARIDLIVEKGGRIYFWDHKSAGRITRRHPWYYARSAQFLLIRWFGRQLGDKFGGVVLNLIQCADKTDYQRPPLDAVPGLLTSLPASLSYYERQRLAFERSGLPAVLWPAVPSEHTCQGRYSACAHARKCDNAVPPVIDTDWPEMDIAGYAEKLLARIDR
jgi:hypothetical protein